MKQFKIFRAGTDLAVDWGDDMGEMAQEAECRHACSNSVHHVIACAADPHGLYVAGEIVYSSKGSPKDD